MKKLKEWISSNKKMAIAFAATAAAVISVITAVIFIIMKNRDEESDKDIVYGYFSVEAENTVGENVDRTVEKIMICDSEGNISYKPVKIEKDNSDISITVKKGELSSDSVFFSLKKADETGDEVYGENISFDGEGTARVELKGLTEGEYGVYIIVKDREKNIHFVSLAGDFRTVVSGDEAGDTAGYEIVALDDISLEDEKLVIKEAHIWRLGENSVNLKGDLYFESDKAGKMKIFNEQDKITCGHVYCDTPEWEYEIANVFSDFSEEHFYYINASSINGQSKDRKELYIDEASKLDRYIETGVFNEKLLAAETENIVFSGEFSISGFELKSAVNLMFKGNVSVENTVNAVFNHDGEWKVSTDENQTSLAEKIRFDLPYTSVVWTGENAMASETAEKYMNYLSYNGMERNPNIGGNGSGLIQSGSFTSVSGGKVPFQPDGNYINVTVSYTENINMDNTAVEAVYTGDVNSSAAIIKDNENWYCIITDSSSNTRGYKINVKTKEYKLPVIYITTEDGQPVTTKETYKKGKFSLDYNGLEEYENISGKDINIRGRGNSSWKLEKKPYKIKFEKKTSIFGLTEAKEWCLIANHADKSLIRNTLAMTLAKKLDNILFVPTSHQVDVFVNGVYGGVYNICEQIEVKDGRIPGEKDSTEIDTDYLLEMGGGREITSFGSNILSTSLCRYVSINSPKEDILTKEQYDYMRDYLDKTDKAIMNGEGYEEYIDVPSLVDYFILHEFSYNLDGSFRRSNFLLKKSGGKLYMAAPWDYDYAFGNMSLDTPSYNDWISLGNASTDNYNEYIQTNWMDYLLKDEYFIEQLKKRWSEVGAELKDTAINTINELEISVAPSAEDNFKVWNVLGRRIQFESGQTAGLGTYSEQIQYLRNYIINRYEWMNKTINAM